MRMQRAALWLLLNIPAFMNQFFDLQTAQLVAFAQFSDALYRPGDGSPTRPLPFQ